MKPRMMVFPFLLALLPMTAGAQERHLGPHVHGQASVSISIDADAMEVQVGRHGHGAVGFEHPPATRQERAALEKATALLNGAAWHVPVPSADCALMSAK